MAARSQAEDDGPRPGLRAILLDAGGTLIHMPRSREAILSQLCRQLGHPITLDQAEAACLASEAYYVQNYLQHCGDQGPFWLSYHGAALRHLGIEDPTGAGAAFLSHNFGQSGVWRAYPDAPEACARLRSLGLRLAVVSNGPATVSDLLSHAGLLVGFDAVLTSQGVGVEKPDPRIFHAALEALEIRPTEALFVGDLYEVDILGARAAGIEGILIDRRDRVEERDCVVVQNLIDLIPIVSKPL